MRKHGLARQEGEEVMKGGREGEMEGRRVKGERESLVFGFE